MATRKGSTRGKTRRPSSARKSTASRRSGGARKSTRRTSHTTLRVVVEQPRAAPTLNAKGRIVEPVVPKRSKF